MGDAGGQTKTPASLLRLAGAKFLTMSSEDTGAEPSHFYSGPNAQRESTGRPDQRNTPARIVHCL